MPGESANRLQDHVVAMACTLEHRGPDDSGFWLDESAGLALGFRRLAIIDLSPNGHQPMQSSSGRWVVVFNGEVYSFAELREELTAKGHRFRGHSDTEVVLEACEQWGVVEAVKRFIGMFAMALWDRRERRLYLVRDRLGIKPLYYAWAGRTLLFGSELKALRAHPAFDAEVDRDALSLFMRHNYVPAPFSIYRSARKLLPGHILCISDGGRIEDSCYWDARQVAIRGQQQILPEDPEGIREQLEQILRDSVKRRMVADVPLGVFLSGGIDSSTVAALMQAQSEGPIRSFSIGVNESGYNEATYAGRIASHLGTNHTELYVTAKETMDVIPRLADLYDEPFADSSQIPMFAVSQLTRRHVTVALSGDGGDELFAGYNRYVWTPVIWRWVSRVPGYFRAPAANILRAVPPEFWEKLAAIVPSKRRPNGVGDKVRKLAETLAKPTPDAVYRQLVSHWLNGEPVLNAVPPQSILDDQSLPSDFPDFVSRMQFLDLVTYLPDDILTKVDRASMGVGLEARVPLLDHRVVEFAWRIPPELKVRDGQGKWILRRVLERYVPPSLFERPKKGFGVPVGAWLRGPLRDWAEDLLDETQIRNAGYLNPAPIRTRWREHLSGQRSWEYHLWDVLMFQAWLRRWAVSS